MSHRFIPDPDASASPPAATSEQTAAIKRWTRDYLALPESAVVFVTETACADPGCPLLETTIAVLDAQPTRQWKLVRPRAAVTKLMVWQTLATPPAHQPAAPSGPPRPA